MSVEIETLNSTLDTSVRPDPAASLAVAKEEILKELEQRRHDGRLLRLLDRLMTARGPVWPGDPGRRSRSGGPGERR